MTYEHDNFLITLTDKMQIFFQKFLSINDMII